jgi:hypothetical protein
VFLSKVNDSKEPPSTFPRLWGNFFPLSGQIKYGSMKKIKNEIAISLMAGQTENELTEGKSVQRINGYSILLRNLKEKKC